MLTPHIMLVGHGPREYFFCSKLIQEGCKVSLYSRKVNQRLHELANGSCMRGPYDSTSICDFSASQNVDLIFPTDEQALFSGLADTCQTRGIPCLGPSRNICAHELSKKKSKTVAKSVDPRLVANFRSISSESELNDFFESLELNDQNYVLKMLLDNSWVTYTNIDSNVKEIAIENFEKCSEVILEDKIYFETEFSVLAIVIDNKCTFTPIAKDYPFRHTGEFGPKTGGMGSVVCAKLQSRFADDNESNSTSIFIQKYIDHIASTTNEKISGLFSFQFFLFNNHIFFNELDIHPGDPESISQLSLVSTKIRAIVESALNHTPLPTLELIPKSASLSMVFVYSSYPGEANKIKERLYTLSEGSITDLGGIVSFGSGTNVDRKVYLSGNSRPLVITVTGYSLSNCRSLMKRIQQKVVGLDFRTDIGEDLEFNHA